MRAVLADAGPLYAIADESDALHERATQELRHLELDACGVLVAYPTLLETYSLVLYRMGNKAAAKWLTYVGDAIFLNATPEDFRQALVRVRSVGDQRITLFDATLAELATRLRLEVWTYNHHFGAMRIPVWRGQKRLSCA